MRPGHGIEQPAPHARPTTRMPEADRFPTLLHPEVLREDSKGEKRKQNRGEIRAPSRSAGAPIRPVHLHPPYHLHKKEPSISLRRAPHPPASSHQHRSKTLVGASTYRPDHPNVCAAQARPYPEPPLRKGYLSHHPLSPNAPAPWLRLQTLPHRHPQRERARACYNSWALHRGWTTSACKSTVKNPSQGRSSIVQDNPESNIGAG
mmetsp:Transcript_3211/g.8688  ORF Transcript_3211/g.8688 Transcript_3211/m.8688 type:complete len:205 (-) Transcript_3211:122-736(-)